MFFIMSLAIPPRPFGLALGFSTDRPLQGEAKQLSAPVSSKTPEARLHQPLFSTGKEVLRVVVVVSAILVLAVLDPAQPRARTGRAGRTGRSSVEVPEACDARSGVTAERVGGRV